MCRAWPLRRWLFRRFECVSDCSVGLFSESSLAYELSRNKSQEPSLAEMTIKAIEILKKNDKGFFLLVEGKAVSISVLLLCFCCCCCCFQHNGCITQLSDFYTS